ncbi:hypothetical protein PUR28_17620 [Streptomyces sp. BE308]|uniref:hypothetical protein n=1 Tax=Streptomyces sp. BE308 TaxID=3002529 RepID=UPI002E75CCFD|nr:hypothetical protein [Streptomyces sp. BE308]MEE1792565.1 hypothetical protein [Streptomyces sp. BE308]
MRRQPRPDRRSGERPGRGPSGEAAEHALSFEQAWEGFAYYIEKVCELQATEPTVADVVSGRYPAADCLMAVCGRAQDSGTLIIERTQLAGAVRPDFTSRTSCSSSVPTLCSLAQSRTLRRSPGAAKLPSCLTD